MSKQLWSLSDPWLYKLILVHVLHLFNPLFFPRPCKNSNRRKLPVLGQYDFWQYLLGTTKRQLEKVNQVTWFTVEVWMHLFLKRVHCAWHIQALTPFLTLHHTPVHTASLPLLFLHIAEFKHRNPMFVLFLSSGCCIYYFVSLLTSKRNKIQHKTNQHQFTEEKKSFCVSVVGGWGV